MVGELPLLRLALLHGETQVIIRETKVALGVTGDTVKLSRADNAVNGKRTNIQHVFNRVEKFLAPSGVIQDTGDLRPSQRTERREYHQNLLDEGLVDVHDVLVVLLDVVVAAVREHSEDGQQLKNQHLTHEQHTKSHGGKFLALFGNKVLDV